MSHSHNAAITKLNDHRNISDAKFKVASQSPHARVSPQRSKVGSSRSLTPSPSCWRATAVRAHRAKPTLYEVPDLDASHIGRWANIFGLRLSVAFFLSVRSSFPWISCTFLGTFLPRCRVRPNFWSTPRPDVGTVMPAVRVSSLWIRTAHPANEHITATMQRGGTNHRSPHVRDTRKCPRKV